VFFKIFRRVVIRDRTGSGATPKGLFIPRFIPTMPIAKNIQLSKVMLLIFMGFKGFQTKYWCVNEETGECQGIYEWDTVADAARYSKSIATKNMTKRSKPGSVSFDVLENLSENRQWQIVDTDVDEKIHFKARCKLA
jgi:hypothetical protein